MPGKSTTKKLRFKSEAEEAEWYRTPEGKRQRQRTSRKALRKGRIIVEEKISIRRAMNLARSCKVVVLKKGADIKPTNPALLRELMNRAKAKKTQAVSLRIPVSDIDAAKKIGAQTGLGYQTVLKEIISKGLRRAYSRAK
jgi:predicted DNA binding CopG/RHH family protein